MHIVIKKNNYLLLNVMRYFKQKFKIESFNPEKFEVQKEWVIDKVNNIGYLNIDMLYLLKIKTFLGMVRHITLKRVINTYLFFQQNFQKNI